MAAHRRGSGKSLPAGKPKGGTGRPSLRGSTAIAGKPRGKVAGGRSAPAAPGRGRARTAPKGGRRGASRR